MDETLIYIYNKIGDTLKEYHYTKKYNKIAKNAPIIFIKKGSKQIKYGTFVEIINNSVIHIINYDEKTIYIYPNKYHIFYVNQTNNTSDMIRSTADYFMNKFGGNREKSEVLNDLKGKLKT